MSENKANNRSSSNAFITGPFSPESNSSRGGPLSHVKIAIKDNIEVADMPCTGGTKALENYIPKGDAPVVDRLRGAGCQIIGKTNLHELAFGITSNNFCFGPVRNPVDPSRFAGGSSGGSAVAVADGTVPLALGTDTGGSCRIPAALCGVIGYRPTINRYSQEGTIPLSSTRDTIGLIGSDLDLIIKADEIITEDIHNWKHSRPQIRLAVPSSYFCEDLSRGIEEGFSGVCRRLSEAGIVLIKEDMQGLPELLTLSIATVMHETAIELPKFLAKTGVSFAELKANILSPDVKGIFETAVAEIKAYEGVVSERSALRHLYEDYFEAHDIDGLFYPTTPAEAQTIEGSNEEFYHNGREVPTFPTMIRNMNPGSYIGTPGITIPAGTTSIGLPFGVHLECLHGEDSKLFSLAQTILSML